MTGTSNIHRKVSDRCCMLDHSNKLLTVRRINKMMSTEPQADSTNFRFQTQVLVAPSVGQNKTKPIADGAVLQFLRCVRFGNGDEGKSLNVDFLSTPGIKVGYL